MTPELWQQVRELLHGAMQVPAAERSAFLDSKCLHDVKLREEVESFLSAEREVSQDFLEPPVTASISVGPGTRLGPYEIASFIGAGGMLVMEFVEGLPINKYCDRRQLTVTQRLEVFRHVCSAVQYAHQHLVIHRDIKPSNVLVSTGGEPKLLDFGLAKILDPTAAEAQLAPTKLSTGRLLPRKPAPNNSWAPR